MDQVKEAVRDPGRFILGNPPLQPEGDIFQNAQMRKESIVLEDHTNITLMRRQPGNILLIKAHIARISPSQACNDAQKSRLPAA
jgi:hypothetical protein